MDYKKYEDTIMKMMHEYFGTEILPFLGIHEKIVGRGPTEISVLSITKMYMDFTFLTASNTYLHLEFQTTDGSTEDLRRFHAYEGWLHYHTGKDVFTYVIFTGGITDALCEERCGINTYRILPVFLADKNADSILEELKRKVATGALLNDEEFVNLAMTPVMSSRHTPKECILEAVNVLKKQIGEKSNQVLAVLYTFAEKFVQNPKDLSELKEVMLMTRLGQMLFDEGLEQGLERGMVQGLEKGLEQGLEKGLEQGRMEARRVNKLYEKLLNDERMDDLKRVLSDSDYQHKLFEEYNL